MWIRTYTHAHTYKYVNVSHTHKAELESGALKRGYCNTHYNISPLLFWSLYFSLFDTIIYFFDSPKKKIIKLKIQLYHKNLLSKWEMKIKKIIFRKKNTMIEYEVEQ